MKHSLFFIALAAGAGAVQAAEQRLLPLVKEEGAQPRRFVGYVLPATQGWTVDHEGREAKVPAEAAAGGPDLTAGYACVGVGPGRSLRWRLEELPGAEFFLYFLLRTGHQTGYEYVAPTMTYVVDLNGTPIDLEPVSEVPAVRVYQSPAGWGHDMSWIRSREKVALKPGDRLTIGCLEQYAFVARCLLVNEAANELTRALGRVEATQQRLRLADELLAKLAEVFPGDEVPAAAARHRERLVKVGERITTLLADVEAASQRMETGGTVDVAALRRQADAGAEALEAAEADMDGELRLALRRPAAALRVRLEAVGQTVGLPGGRMQEAVGTWTGRSFYAREAHYAYGVAATYLDSGEAQLAGPPGLKGLQRAGTYLWRADQFLTRAEKAVQSIPAEEPSPPRPPPSQGGEVPTPPKLAVRGTLLLNGEWEVNPGGQPDAPPTEGWWKIRVPHGPWHETVGQFMALDRQWPGGQSWAWYRTIFPVPAGWDGGRLKLHFEAVFHLCEVYVNGAFCGRHIGGFDPFEVDITAAARPGEPNELLCFVQDTSYTALPQSERRGEPTGCSSGPNHFIISDLWGARFGGIWQDVSLEARPAVYVRDVFVVTSYRKREITVQTWVTNESNQPVTVAVQQEVVAGGRVALRLPPQRLSLEVGQTARVEVRRPWPRAKLWGIGGAYGDPAHLYFLRTRLRMAGEKEPLDTHFQRFGFREFWIEDGQFWLNGQRLPLQGGGTWYLQEGKIPHGHRWFARHFYQVERGMNVNIERWHRHGDVAREFFDVGDELGMLSEPEGPYWGCYGVPDLLGFTDWDDPVWTANVTEHYRRWARKHRNHPSLVLWSIENETFTSERPPEMLARFLSFGEALREEDPTRPVTYHGSENGGHATADPRLEIVNLHYPSNDHLRNWRDRWGGRPCVNGEFQNYPALFHTSSPDPPKAAESMVELSRWIEATWQFYREIELSGAFYFLPSMAALFSTARPEYRGPWGDRLPPSESAPAAESGWAAGLAQLSARVPISWPSLSGPGIKCEQLIAGSEHRSLINWFDPARPQATPTPIYGTLKRAWPAMPPLNPRKAPELIVTVTRRGQPVAGAAVLATPLDGQCTGPQGVMSDPAGTAWLVFQEPGRYRVDGAGHSRVFEASWGRTDAPPGYADIPRLTLER